MKEVPLMIKSKSHKCLHQMCGEVFVVVDKIPVQATDSQKNLSIENTEIITDSSIGY